MAWILLVKLLDALAEIGLVHLNPDGSHVVPEAAFLGQHRLAFDQRRGVVVAQDAVHNLVMLGGVARPMHVNPIRSRIGLELVEILVEMGERVLLDRRSERPKLLPFRNAVHLAVALLSQIPEPLVVHLLMLGSGDETRGSRLLVDRSVAADLGTPRRRLGSRPPPARRPLTVSRAAAAPEDAIVVDLPQQLQRP